MGVPCGVHSYSRHSICHYLLFFTFSRLLFTPNPLLIPGFDILLIWMARLWGTMIRYDFVEILATKGKHY
jgi:hypothetical protein